MAQMSCSEAIRDGIRMEMRRDPNVFLAGEDVGIFGGCFGVTAGLLDEFGKERVVDTPVTETAIMGLGVGSAATGLRPIVEIMFADFMGVCLDELYNQAAKMRYMFGGKTKIPMVIRAPVGAGVSAAAQHSQSNEAWFTHIPGIKVVMPASPADAKGLMEAAVRDDNPVVYLEHKLMLGVQGDVPEGEYIVPIGKADIKRSGKDVSLIAWSAMVSKSLAAAEMLAAEGIDAEVVDLRTLVYVAYYDSDYQNAPIIKLHFAGGRIKLDSVAKGIFAFSSAENDVFMLTIPCLAMFTAGTVNGF